MAKTKKARKRRDIGKVFLGILFLLIAVYVAVIMPTTSMEAKYFGGGILALLGLVFLISELRK